MTAVTAIIIVVVLLTAFAFYIGAFGPGDEKSTHVDSKIGVQPPTKPKRTPLEEWSSTITSVKVGNRDVPAGTIYRYGGFRQSEYVVINIKPELLTKVELALYSPKSIRTSLKANLLLCHVFSGFAVTDRTWKYLISGGTITELKKCAEILGIDYTCLTTSIAQEIENRTLLVNLRCQDVRVPKDGVITDMYSLVNDTVVSNPIDFSISQATEQAFYTDVCEQGKLDDWAISKVGFLINNRTQFITYKKKQSELSLNPADEPTLLDRVLSHNVCTLVEAHTTKCERI